MPDPDKYTFDPGVDYTLQFAGYASALTSGQQLMVPNAQHGIVAYMETQPQTTGQPSGYPTNWYTFNARGLWVKPSTGETYSYKTGVGFTNVASLIPANTITGAMIKANTVNLSNLYVPSGTTAGYVPMVNGGGTLSFSDVITGRVDGSIPAAKIAPGTANQFLRTISGTVQWDTFDGTDINALLSVNRLQPTYVVPGAPYQVLATDPTANFSNWYDLSALIQPGSIAIASLSGTGGIAGQMIVRNSSNTGWTWATPAGSSPITKVWSSGNLTVSNQTVSHSGTISGTPALWKAVVVCTDAGGDAGYALNDELDVNSVVDDISAGNSEECPYITIVAQPNDFKVVLTATPNQLYVTNGTTYAAKSTWDPAKWRIKITAYA